MEPKGQVFFTNFDEKVFIPLTTAQKRLTGSEAINAIQVEALSPAVVGGTRDAVEALLRERHGGVPDFRIRSQDEFLSTRRQTITTFRLLLGGIAAISLLGIPFPLVVLAAALAGWALGNRFPGITDAHAVDDDTPARPPDRRHTLLLLAVGIPLWLAPVALAALVFGGDSVIVDGEIVVESGRATKVDEAEVLRLAAQARHRLDPSIQRELAAARTMEQSLASMYFRVFDQ